MKEWVPRVVSEEEMDAIFREAGIYDVWMEDLAKQNSVNKVSYDGKNNKPTLIKSEAGKEALS